jgi:hypothetical protein
LIYRATASSSLGAKRQKWERAPAPPAPEQANAKRWRGDKKTTTQMPERRMGMQTAEFKAQGLDGRIHRVVEFTEYLESISTNKKRQSSNIRSRISGRRRVGNLSLVVGRIHGLRDDGTIEPNHLSRSPDTLSAVLSESTTG